MSLLPLLEEKSLSQLIEGKRKILENRNKGVENSLAFKEQMN